MVEITFRAENGLPLVATPYINRILKGILARAQNMYSQKVCHFLFMANHLHMQIVVENPDLVPSFIRYVKQESAHAINRLLGRTKNTVWCEGYDSPQILDAKKAIERIVYLYTNPQKADLVDKIEEYPNFSSWEAFIAGGSKITAKRIPRDAITPLPKKQLSLEKQEEFAAALEEKATKEHSLTIEPNAWMGCFPELEGIDPAKINEEIIRRIREDERMYRKKRTKPVLGANALRLQSMKQKHRPKSWGKRMMCLSSDEGLRARYIQWRNYLSELRFTFRERFKAGNPLAKLPPGLFAPGGALLANINPLFLPMELGWSFA